MNLPNKLTIFRVILNSIFCIFSVNGCDLVQTVITWRL